MSNLLDMKESKGFAEFIPIPEGTYDAVLVGIVQLGSHMQSYQGKETGIKQELALLFEIPGLQDSVGQNRMITKTVVVPGAITAKSNFYKIFKSMKLIDEPTVASVSKVFGTKESLESALGIGVTVEIVNYEKRDGSTGHAIDKNAIRRLDPRLPQPKALTEPFVFTLKEPDSVVFKTRLTHYNRTKIMEATDSNKLPREFHDAYIAELEERTKKAEERKSSDGGPI